MNSSSGSQIIVIGSINTDMLVQAESLPHPGETVLGNEFRISGGGKGANQAVAAARLGGNVMMAACVGDDMFGKQALDNLQAESIDCQHILTSSAHSSGVALISVDQNGENQIVVSPGANNQVSAEQVSAILNCADENSLVLLQLEIPLAIVSHAIRVANEKGARVILDPAPAQVLSDEIYAGVYLLTPNQTEAQQLTGITVIDEQSAEAALRHLLQAGAHNVALTLGPKGVLLGAGETMELIPGVPVEAVDTTAAGDCFNGALASALSRGLSLPDAAGFACKAASFAVTQFGAQDAMPSITDLN